MAFDPQRFTEWQHPAGFSIYCYEDVHQSLGSDITAYFGKSYWSEMLPGDSKPPKRMVILGVCHNTIGKLARRLLDPEAIKQYGKPIKIDLVDIIDFGCGEPVIVKDAIEHLESVPDNYYDFGAWDCYEGLRIDDRFITPHFADLMGKKCRKFSLNILSTRPEMAQLFMERYRLQRFKPVRFLNNVYHFGGKLSDKPHIPPYFDLLQMGDFS